MTTLLVKKQISPEEMYDLYKQRSTGARHANVVFTNEKAAKHRDMAQTIGRFEPSIGAIAFNDDKDVGTKYAALFNNGFGLHVTQNNDGNWYADVSPARDMMEAISDTKNVDHKDERPFIRLEEDEFLNDHSDGAFYINFTTPTMNHDHHVGQLNLESRRYTIRPDLIKELDDFEYELDEDEEGPVANVMTDSIPADKLIKVLTILKAEDELDDDDTELDENYTGIERGTVYVPSLGGIKSLLRALAVSKRHGDMKAVDENVDELNELLDELEQGDAEGIEDVRAEMEQILHGELNERQKRQTTTPRVGKAVDREASKHSSTYRKAKKLAKSASNIAKAFKSKREQQEVIETHVDAGRRHDGMTDDELIKQALNY
ncbi:conserved hypothetical protein [Vibrio jasicida]|uniref:Uncharacterized protein n=1 Tax=Vibrio jasicida TaxID=766224 RepID=A0AAU9QWM7_9VIBR|nr:conserved hypothetical protein [Vibrio jasicida]CAH1603517.1 conserved hypothetical protein [Vibrio jasicida]